MLLGTTLIDATFAEAFRMRYVRLIVTAHDDYWRQAAAVEATGYASSIIGCDDGPIAEVRVDLPVRRHRPEVDHAHMSAWGLVDLGFGIGHRHEGATLVA